MMHFNKSIVAFDCNYNRASTEDKAAFFENTTELVNLINSSELFENSEVMKEIAERRYTWKIVKQQYFDLLK
jgi:hypothetical protein